jgi:hypothetical protein
MASLFRIALLGNPGSGKSSIGDALIDLAGGTRLSFADGVKEEAALVHAFAEGLYDEDRDTIRIATRVREAVVKEMQDPEKKDRYRRLLQVWGTDFRRAENPQYWIEQWAKKFNKIREGANIVVDDCRFPNEEVALRSNGFYFVRLLDGETTRPQGATEAVHESESYWPKFVTDLDLSYEAGPEHQARRILSALLST